MSTANVPASAARRKVLTVSNILEELPTVTAAVEAVVVSKSKKRGASALRKTKSGYLLFCDKTRPVISASSPQGKLKELGERWQFLSVADKQLYEAQAKAMREEAKKTAVPAVPEEDETEFPMKTTIKEEGDLDTFVARITRAAIKGFLEDLVASAKEGKTYTVHNVGSLKLKKSDAKDLDKKKLTSQLTYK